MPSSEGDAPTSAVPAAIGFGVMGSMAFGFGMGFGSRSYTASAQYKDLLEKFPDKPTPEAEALARSGATRAFLAGTALAGLMGVGAVCVARAYGINSAADFAEEIKKWLPAKDGLEAKVMPKLDPLTRSISKNLQSARDAAGQRFEQSEMGRSLIKKAEESAEKRGPAAQWEKDLVQKLEADHAPAKK